ncbi:hypothetical protein BH09PAT2_BH09PAT2_09000 [soil metagenome]
MLQIIQYSISIIALLYFIGYGVTSLFLPKHLRKDIIWLIPWTGVAMIAVCGAILSFAKVPMALGAYIIVGVSAVSIIYALLLKRIEKVSFIETALLALGFIVCYIINIYPLLKIGFPTVISLGNVDPVTYTNVADFFVHHTVWQGKEILPYSPSLWAVGDIVHYSYRWGSALLLSFFNVILDVRSYEIFSIMISLLFALSFPILYVFAKQLSRRFLLVTGILIFLTFALNSTLTYMLYHVFFGQFAFLGLYIFILMLLITNQYQMQKEESLSAAMTSWTGTEILLGFLISSVTTIYPEGLVFILIPFGVVTAISYIYTRDARTLGFFIKVVALTIAINPVTAYTSVLQNLKVIFTTSRNVFIGWEPIRHASPLEMLGFYNVYYYRPLPIVLSLAIAFIFVGIWFVGFVMSRHKLWIITLVSMFGLLLLHFVVTTPNFFLYHRNITYSVFLFSVLFSIGVATILSRFPRVYVFLALIILTMITVRSFRRSFSQFYYHRIVVDASLISLQKLAKDTSVPTPFYTAEVFIGEYNLWRRLWQDYMLTDTKVISNTNYSTEKFEKRLPKTIYVLAEKNKLSQGQKNLVFTDIVWENGYYVVGELVRPNDVKNKPLQ